MRLRILDLPLDIADSTRFALILDEVGPDDLDEASAAAIAAFGQQMGASAVLMLPCRVELEPMMPLYGEQPTPSAAAQVVHAIRDAVASVLPGDRS